MDEFEHLKIQLEEIKKATNNFGNTVIGSGGFGKVYEGEVSHSNGRSKVAIKRLDRKLGQGDPEFWKEIMMLSSYTHKNLISLLGFCDEDNEKILVYEYASKGSLDRHLSSTNLMWTQRINICLDAARGINYLHDPKGTQQRVIHRDIKSSNILLDDKWNAKVSDMGLAKTGPANQKYTFLVTNVVGTLGYWDPTYYETLKLTKESDAYSFGVVLFEVLCGRLCCTKDNNGQLENLVPMWKQSYEHKKLDEIIFQDLKPSMDSSSLKTFSDIAFRCMHRERKQRPTMSHVVEKLEVALKFQKRYDIQQAKDSKERMKGVEATDQLYKYVEKALSNVFFNRGEKNMEGTKQKDTEGSGGGTVAKGAAPPQAEAPKEKFISFEGATGFTADDILSATAYKTGENAYWIVYRVTLEGGEEFAVRRLRESITKYQRELEIEINLVGKIRHPNLLALRGYFIDPAGVKALIFDYMLKGNLATFLHDHGLKTPVDWPTRMQIAKGIARGLLSLHTHHNIIHGNLKSKYILLDENINPKIAHFGLSLLMKSAKMSSMAGRILANKAPKLRDSPDMRVERINTKYKAPELFKLEKANAKTDVYSLGVIMLEILTGESPAIVDLPKWAASAVNKESGIHVFDYKLPKDTPLIAYNQLMNTLKLAWHCVDPSPSDRPDVNMVLQQLEEILPTNSGDAGPSKRERKWRFFGGNRDL